MNTERKAITVAFGILQRAKESPYPEILRELCDDGEIATVNGFLSLLELFNGHKQQKVMFNIAAAMLTLLHRKSDYFMFTIFKKNLFGASRLNVVKHLQYYSVSPLMILGNLFLNQFSKENVKRAVKNYNARDVTEVVRLVAVNARDPAKVYAQMRKTGCFADGYVDVDRLERSDQKVRDFCQVRLFSPDFARSGRSQACGFESRA